MLFPNMEGERPISNRWKYNSCMSHISVLEKLMYDSQRLVGMRSSVSRNEQESNRGGSLDFDDHQSNQRIVGGIAGQRGFVRFSH